VADLRALVLLCVFVAGCAHAPARERVVQDPARACAALAGAVIPVRAFDLPTGEGAVREATLIAPSDEARTPEYCRVRGEIAAASAADPVIMFQVNLPTRWNAKTVQHGGGGLNGVVIEATGAFAGGGGEVAPALAQGYVTYGSDSGHQGATRDFYDNAQAFANYSHEAVKRSFDLMQAVVVRYYGAAPRRNYHIGGSKGGQEALQAAQRYYADFDGVVSYYPAMQNQSLQLSWNRMWHYAFNNTGGALDASAQTLLRDAVMRTCDTLDGAADGIVSDLRGCAQRFDVSVLRCPSGRAANGCLSDAQIAALNAAASILTFQHPMPNGVAVAGPWPIYNGGDLETWFGTGVDGSQQAFFRSSAARPEWAASVDQATWAENVLRTAQVYDASNPNLDGFRARGGRIILVQGTTDMLVPPSMTDRYFEALQARYDEGLRDFARYYVVPGYGHGGGAFTSSWDALSALDAWVEAGAPPAAPVTVDRRAPTHRARPLCEYPSWPRYGGSGSLDEAASFVCAGP